MDVTHEKVNHRQFGIGKVTVQTLTTVTVEFCEEYGCKKFFYPSAFESFLELCSSTSKKQMDSELGQIRQTLESDRRILAKENEERNAHLRTPLKKRHAPVKKRTLKVAKPPILEEPEA